MALDEVLAGIPWPELTHAYGSASDTPDKLRALLSDDAEICQRALYELWGSIYHQGTVYEASAPAVHCLLEILNEVQSERKPAILGLLAGLASRDVYSLRTTHTLMIRWADAIDSDLKHTWLHYDTRIERDDTASHWMRLAHAATAKGVPT